MFEIKKLKNGVTVVMEKLPFLRSISLGIFVGNGSRNENETTNGISHFIEHMLFKGTEKRSAKDIAEEMDAIGGQINAYTTKEYTCYYTRTLDTHFDTAIDIISDMYFNSKFDNKEIEKECKVIVEEINMYEDDPEDLVYDMMQYNVWKQNSLGFPILGTEKTISKFNHETFIKYKEKNYRPDNTVISVAGNFDENYVMEKIKNYFEDWKQVESDSSENSETIYNQCIVSKEKDIEQIHLCISFPGIAIGTDESYILTALNTILGGGMSSKLFQRIREQNGLAYSIYSYNSNFKDVGLFSIYAALNPSQLSDVINLIFDEIKNLKINKIDENQLSKTKEQIKSNFILSLESSSNRMSSIGRSQLLLKKILSPEELIKKVDDITIEKLYALIDKIFDFDKASLSVVGKLKGIDLNSIFENAKK